MTRPRHAGVPIPGSGSFASPLLLSYVIIAKHANSIPLYRLAKDFKTFFSPKPSRALRAFSASASVLTLTLTEQYPHGSVERVGHPVGEPGEIQRASVREHALSPPVADGGELVVEHLRRAVDAPREPVYGARFQGMGDGAGQEPASVICAALATPPASRTSLAIPCFSAAPLFDF